MAQIQKLEIQVGIKSSAARLYQVFRSKQYLIPKMSPGIVKDVKIVQGDWESIDSIKEWSYVAGDSETAKQAVLAVDDENKTITMRSYGASIDKYYKMFKPTMRVAEGSVTWTLEYEKQNDDVPPPNKYMDLAPALTKNVDDYLSKNA